MQELKFEQVEYVNGAGFFIPVIMWAVKSTAIRTGAKAVVAGASAATGVVVYNSVTSGE